MDSGVTILAVFDAVFFFGGILSVIILPGWLQARRREMARRQISLTDALDAEFGPIVAPVVTKPLRGPWVIEIEAPLVDRAQVGKMLAVIHDTLCVVHGMVPGSYLIVLRAKPGSVLEARGTRAHRYVTRWAGDPAAI
jgi:hypothetical protein